MEIRDTISSGLLELFVLGLASEQEVIEITALSKFHPEVAAEIAAIESGLKSYAMIHAVKPEHQIKEALFTKINTKAKIKTGDSKVVPISSFWKYVAAASIILLTVSVIFNVLYYGKYQTATQNFATAEMEINNAQEQLATLEESNRSMKNDMVVIQSKYSEPLALRGQPDAPDAAAKIFWMKNTTGEVYIDPSNLPEPPTGMQYQFWGFVNGKPVDGGLIVFNKHGDKYHIQKMKSFGKAEAFAVTLETKGGHPQPEGKLFVMGKM